MIGMYAHLSIDNILFVEGLKGNLLSISQLCNNGYDVSFNKDECIVKKKETNHSQEKVSLTHDNEIQLPNLSHLKFVDHTFSGFSDVFLE